MLERLGGAVRLSTARADWWAVALAGFLARGGIVLFLAPLIELPSPVTVTLMFGADSISGSGQPSPRFVAILAILALSTLVAVAFMATVAAWSDVALFDRVTAATRSGDEEGEVARRPSRGRVPATVWLQALGLLPGLAGLVLAFPAVRDAAVSEFLFPSAPEVPYLLRVIEGAESPLIRAAILLAAGEALATVATRLFLEGRSGGSAAVLYGASLVRLATRPVGSLLAWLAGWTVLIGGLLIGLAAVSLAWMPLRVALLEPKLVLPFAAVASVLFVVVWFAALALVGVASMFRSTLWTLTLAARPAQPSVVRWRVDARA